MQDVRWQEGMLDCIVTALVFEHLIDYSFTHPPLLGGADACMFYSLFFCFFVAFCFFFRPPQR